jgi:hypothetical protein
MEEGLPVVLGVLVGACALQLPSGARRVAFPVACVVVGAFASAVNGEFASEGWLFFVSFDSLLVWVSASVVLTAGWWLQRQRALR